MLKINNEQRNNFRYIENTRDSSILRGLHFLRYFLSNKNLTLDVFLIVLLVAVPRTQVGFNF